MKDDSRNNQFSNQSERFSPYRKRNGRRWKRFIPVLLLTAVVVVVSLAWLIVNYQEMSQADITAEKQSNVGSGYRNITYQGKNYRYNNRITVILYAGVDSDETLRQYAKYTMAPRADTISLLVLDELHKKMTVIGLSRDTMTKIRRYSMSGKKSGLYLDHLGYAYTYGDGGKASTDGLCEAVSLLLYGIPVNHYVITSRVSLGLISDIVGPVEVTVPNNDLAEIDPMFAEGARVTIDKSNFETFIRHRDTEKAFSNVGRMERQQAYITAALERIKTLVSEKPDQLWDSLQATESYFQTDITRNQYLDLVKIMKNVTFSGADYYTPEGEQVEGEYHDEFYPNEQIMLDKLVKLFYI